MSPTRNFGLAPPAAFVCDQMGAADQMHHPNRHRALGQWVSFVMVEATLHTDDRHTGKVTEHEPSNMARNRRHGEVWYRLVVEAVHIGQLIRQRPQARTANDTHFRTELSTVHEELGNFLQCVIGVHSADTLFAIVDEGSHCGASCRFIRCVQINTHSILNNYITLVVYFCT